MMILTINSKVLKKKIKLPVDSSNCQEGYKIQKLVSKLDKKYLTLEQQIIQL